MVVQGNGLFLREAKGYARYFQVLCILQNIDFKEEFVTEIMEKVFELKKFQRKL